MVRQIPLTKGQFALVDDADYEQVMIHDWRAQQKFRKDGTFVFYAYRCWSEGDVGRKKFHTEGLHRFLMQCPEDIDHEDGDGLNNQRSNIRKTTDSQNQANRKAKLNGASSSYRGVCWNFKSNKWQAGIKVKGKSFHLGLFEREEDAATAYDSEARERFGEFANPNFSA